MIKEEVKSDEFVKWFSELNKDSKREAGGKGANLAEIYNLKIQVPPGFVVTAQAYFHFIAHAKLKDKIEHILKGINYEDTKHLDESTEKIRNLIIEADYSKELQEEIIEAYESLNSDEEDNVDYSPLDILSASHENYVAVRSSATAEDLAEASFAGQQDTFVNVKGDINVLKHVKMCFASLFTARATYYRNKTNFDHMKTGLAVVVQKMVDSLKSGVVFSKNPSYNTDDITIEAVWGLGEGIVSGAITPDRYIVSRDFKIKEKIISNKKIAYTKKNEGGHKVVKLTEERSKEQVLKDHEIKRLADIAVTLEEHYKKPQDIEFAIDKEDIFIVQTRPITTIEKRLEEKDKKEISGDTILVGIPASPGIASGKVKIIKKMEDLNKIITGDILVTQMTNPDMVVTMQKSAGIITDEGGLTAHAAIVSREMGIPCVVGTKEATTKLKDGQIVTVDGYTGKIYDGERAETKKMDIKPVEVQTKTQIKVIVDLPSFAERAAKTNLKKVGLTRIEGIIAEGGKHPMFFIQNKNYSAYEEIIYKGVREIAKHFEEVWVRTSDIRSDEFQHLEGAPKKIEVNPMLGMHGIRFSLKYPEFLKAELNALKRIASEGKQIGILLPQVILVDEVLKVKEMLKQMNFTNAKLGVMIETPAAVQIIKELCETGIQFISFGTNDLTQYILAIDRGNEELQHLYNEMNPAVLREIEYVIRICKKYNVESSICGQAGSNKEMVKFLVERGIDSISTNADAAAEIARYVKELEDSKVKGTDKEPRLYEQKKQEETVKATKQEEYNGIETEEALKLIQQEKEETKNNKIPLKENIQEDLPPSKQEKYNGISTEEAIKLIEKEKKGEADDDEKSYTEEELEEELKGLDIF